MGEPFLVEGDRQVLKHLFVECQWKTNADVYAQARQETQFHSLEETFT